MEFAIYFAISIAISVAMSFLMPTKTTKQKPQLFNDESFPKVEEGTAKIHVFGQVNLPDWYVEWNGNYRTKAIKKKGGKK